MPANAGAIRAGDTFIEMFLDRAAAIKGLQDFENRFRRVGASLSRIQSGVTFGRGFQSQFTRALAGGIQGIANGSLFTKAFDRAANSLGLALNHIFSGAFFARISNQFRRAGQSLFLGGAIATGFFATLTALIAKPVAAFSDFEQKIGRFEQVFGNLSNEAKDFSTVFAHQVRNSVVKVMDEMVQFQSVLLGLKFNSTDSLQFAKNLTQLTEDLAAFDNITPEDALARILSGVNGMVVPVQRFGANVRKAALEEEALAMGINDSNAKLSLQQKTLLRIKILNDAAARAHIGGQARREFNFLASIFRGLGAAAYDANVALGSAIAPTIANAGKLAIKLAVSFTQWANANRGLVAVLLLIPPILTGLAVTAAAIGVAFFTAGTFLRAFIIPLRVLALPIKAAQIALLGVAAAIGVVSASTSALLAMARTVLVAAVNLGIFAGGVALAARRIGEFISLGTNLSAWISGQLVRGLALGVAQVASLGLAFLRLRPRLAVIQSVFAGLASAGFKTFVKTVSVAAATMRVFQLALPGPKIAGLLTGPMYLAIRQTNLWHRAFRGVSTALVKFTGIFVATPFIRVSRSVIIFIQTITALGVAFTAAALSYTAFLAAVASTAVFKVLQRMSALFGFAAEAALRAVRRFTLFSASLADLGGAIFTVAMKVLIRNFKDIAQCVREVIPSILNLGRYFIRIGTTAVRYLGYGLIKATLAVADFGLQLVKLAATGVANAATAALTGLATVFTAVATAAVTATVYLATGIVAVAVPVASLVIVTGLLAIAFTDLAKAAVRAYAAVGGLKGIFNQIFEAFGGGFAVISDQFARAFDRLGVEARAAWVAISQSIATGDLVAAFRVMWSFIRVEFARGWKVLAGYWDRLRANSLTTINVMWANIQRAFSEGFLQIQLYGDLFRASFLQIFDTVKAAATAMSSTLGSIFNSSGLSAQWDDQKTAILNVAAILQNSFLDAILAIRKGFINVKADLRTIAAYALIAMAPFGKTLEAGERKIAQIIQDQVRERVTAENEITRAKEAGNKSRADIQSKLEADRAAAEQRIGEAQKARQAEIDAQKNASAKTAAEMLSTQLSDFATTLLTSIGNAWAGGAPAQPGGDELLHGFQAFFNDVAKRLGFKGGDQEKAGKVAFRRSEAVFADLAFRGAGAIDVSKAQLQVLRRIEKNQRDAKPLAPAKFGG